MIPGIAGAKGLVGPPLTLMGGRIRRRPFRNTPQNLAAWVLEPQRFVPGNAMPSTGLDRIRSDRCRGLSRDHSVRLDGERNAAIPCGIGAGCDPRSLVSPARGAADCPADHDKLEKALKASVKPSGGPSNGGLDNNEWAALVTRDGAVCAVAFSGAKPDDQWPGSRAIAIEKANTANALSLNGFALSTANLYAGAQPGGVSLGWPRAAAQPGGSLLRRSNHSSAPRPIRSSANHSAA